MVTTLKLPSPILVSQLIPKVVIAVGGVVVGAFSGMLSDFFYYSYSSKCVTKPCRSTTVDLLLGVRYIGKEVNNIIT